MITIFHALELLGAAKISGEQTALIDAALSVASAEDISDIHVANVIEYIDMQLLHNAVKQEVRGALDRLQEKLRSRGQLATTNRSVIRGGPSS